jgi:hypothetical protein
VSIGSLCRAYRASMHGSANVYVTNISQMFDRCPGSGK